MPGLSQTLANFLAACVVATATARPLAAQTLSGQVIDLATRHPVGGAVVELYADSARLAASVHADSATGMFYVDAPKPGLYRVVVHLPSGDVFLAPPERFDSTETVERQYSVPLVQRPDSARGIVYFPTEVDTIALPRHIEVPRIGDIPWWNGQIPAIAQVTFAIVVDTTGRADPDSWQVLQTTTPPFAEAVRQKVRTWRFTPASKNGHRVRMMWTQMFAVRTVPRDKDRHGIEQWTLPAKLEPASSAP